MNAPSHQIGLQTNIEGIPIRGPVMNPLRQEFSRHTGPQRSQPMSIGCSRADELHAEGSVGLTRSLARLEVATGHGGREQSEPALLSHAEACGCGVCPGIG